MCLFKLLLFLFILQAVKRSHRRLGLAQKLMEQVVIPLMIISTVGKIEPCTL